MPMLTAINLKVKSIFGRVTIPSSRKFVLKDILFPSQEAKELPRGYFRYLVNAEHNMIAVGCLDKKVVHFVSMAFSTK